MHFSIKNLATRSLQALDIAIIRQSRLSQIEESSRVGNLVALLMDLPTQHKAQILEALRLSKSQLGQDLFVLSETNFKRNGYFVDFGATNGVRLNNSFLLEKEFGWSGIVAEPARRWHEDLKRSRSCHIEMDCVWHESNATLTFNEATVGEFSTINSYSSSDGAAPLRKGGKKYEVNTISLEDLLDKYDAPREIDYLSIDTEGSEFEILRSFDFKKYQFGVITCEHNFGPQRESIFSLLTQNGYIRKFERVSNQDDWYIRARPAPGAPGPSPERPRG